MSLKEIAALSGTSVATVSRVLNHPEHRCNENGLSEKIWAAAAELNYVPNTAARNLRLGAQPQAKPFTVDIFLTRFDSLDKDVFFLEVFNYLKEELLQAGCTLGDILHSVDILSLGSQSKETENVPFHPQTQAPAKNGSSMFIPRKENTGLIVLGKCPSNIIPILRKRYSCIAGIDRNPTDYEYDEVVCNGTTAAEKAVEYLISLGHKNIAYIGDCTYEARYIGYYQTLLNHKLPLNHTNVYPTNQTQEEGYQTMLSIIRKREWPTAIFCANDSTALGVLQALKRNKKRGYLPSVISIDNIDASGKTSPMLTTIEIPKREMSHLALILLLDRRKKCHEEYVRIELPCRLIERESCGYL
ncbi:MAG: LacI family transcriptional regulator [Bacteroidales bacterium]|nr:LacI family transcriptional regulator [Clostridium sp.]MCM1203407.1 LacI family transcriptional regulator [Bacteroidales bacterium]